MFNSRYSNPVRVSIDSFADSCTKQCFKDECNINLIMKRWEKSGVINHLNNNQPSYSDVSEFVDYQTSLNIIMRAQSAFMALPASIRARFSNDPQEFVNFCTNPANATELQSLGLTSVREPSTDAASAPHAGVAASVGGSAPEAVATPATGS